MRNRIGAAVGCLVLAAAGALVASPAQAVQSGSFKICNSSGGFDYIHVWRTDGGLIQGGTRLALYPNGACSDWLWPAGIRVDTDPSGQSHSYKLKVTDANGNGGSYGDCHTNSDNHASDPPNPSSGEVTRVYYRNFDHGDCTN